MVVRAGRFYAILVVGVLAGAVALRIADPFFLQALRFIAFDSYQRVQPLPYNPDYPVRVVDIDEESLARIGQWPWPRTTIAELVHKLVGQQAATIGFDILFSEPDIAALVADRIPAGESHDAAFAAAIASAPTVLAAALTNRAADGPALPVKAGFAVAGDDPASFVATFSAATSNLPALNQAAVGIGS
nr:CHASE2 domain-containing protein [Bauldia sp.]